MNDNDQMLMLLWKIIIICGIILRDCISSVCAYSHVEFNKEHLKTSLEEKVLK